MKRFLWIFLQFVLIAGIFGFLFWSAATATDDDGKNIFAILWEQPKRWHFLAAALFAQLVAVVITFIRWRWLVRTLGLECSHREAFRFGFLSFMLNLAPLGIVGGDAVKAVLIAQRNPDYKAQAVASVFIDRFVGLLVMFICGTVFVCWTGFALRTEILAKTFTHLVFVFTAVSLIGTGIVFLPFFAKGHFERLIEKIPLAGGLASKLISALLLYRNHKRCLLQSGIITIFVHIFFGLSIYWIASGLFQPVPDVANHIMLHNVANLTSMIPLAAGPYEWVLEKLYRLFGMSIGMGFVVALMYRLTMIAIAGLGMVFYYVIKRK
ncbi:MAG: flippase-like domain-containing protein [Planctomycetaceae bacterium]|nr:flippase-like domain-containing protein [Planctomycetaceae bacterium]